MSPLDNGLNDSFARAAREAAPSGQTETVYAQRVEWEGRDTEYWNVQPRPFTDEQMRSSRESAQRWGRQEGNMMLAFREVKRQVTITATEWEATE